jgi:Fe-S oxidoreductase
MAMSGKFGIDGLTDHRLYNVLDLCLECKACKSECPSKVDMARLKAEFLAHYYKKHGLPLSKRFVSNLRKTAELTSYLPNISNSISKNRFGRWLLEKIVGIDRRRIAPLVSEQTLTSWFTDNKTSIKNPTGQPVALFVDTFVNFYEPHIGIAAVQLLKKIGCNVTLANAGCCGRPLISTGQLAAAKAQGKKLIENLGEFAKQSIPIIVLEPSCLSTLKDDYLDLIDDPNLCRQVSQHIKSLEDFLISEKIEAKFSQEIGNGPKEILFHGHCQQKSLFGTENSLQTLSALEKTHLLEVDSGCCGMAGSFGYEKGHYDISKQIGDLRLFPAIQDISPETEIVASGFSCRSQIQHFTGRQAKHLAEILLKYSK